MPALRKATALGQQEQGNPLLEIRNLFENKLKRTKVTENFSRMVPKVHRKTEFTSTGT
jgi:predicted phage-related endonuclease